MAVRVQGGGTRASGAGVAATEGAGVWGEVRGAGRAGVSD